MMPTHNSLFKKKIFFFFFFFFFPSFLPSFLPSHRVTFCVRACVRFYYYYQRYIDQILGLLDDDDESGSGPGAGDLEVYERAVSFLSGDVEPTSDLDDVSLAYVQIPHLEMMECELSP
jgi:hypothetical protein